MSRDSDAMRRFLEIESKYNLYEANVSGVDFWNYARMTIWNYEICADRLHLQEAHQTGAGQWKKKMQSFASLIRYSVFRGKRAEKPVDLLIFAHERRVKTGAYYECIYTEALAQNFVSLTLEHPHNYEHLRPVGNRDLMYTDYLVVKGNLYHLLHRKLHTAKYKEIYHAIESRMEDPLEEMRESFCWDLDKGKIIRMLTERVFTYLVEQKELDRIVRKTSPKAIVEVVYYGMQKMIANELGKKYGIPTIELQHGTMHSEHAGYQFADGAAVRQLPDYMFLFSEFWKTQIHVPIPENHMRVTGFPYFERQMRRYREKTVREDNRQTILFVSQGTIGRELSRIAAETASMLPEETYRILYKLHPGEYADWQTKYPWLADSGIKVYDNSEINIYELFAVSDMQVGVYSTAIYEGLGFGLRTLICEVGHWKTMEALIRGGYAESFRSADELKNLLLSAEPGSGKEGNVFWKENAMENMTAELKVIFSNRRSEYL